MELESDYVGYLKKELAERARRNPRYSLRAFARDLEFSASYLSEVLNGKHHFSRAAATKTAERLGLNEREKRFFADLVEFETAESVDARNAADARLQVYRHDNEVMDLAEDKFRLIADWYHFAILELLTLRRVRSDADSIADRLDIEPVEAADALARLEKLGLIARHGTHYEVLKTRTFTGGNIPSKAMKKFHAQMLHKAEDALFTQPISQRDFDSALFSIDDDEIDEAKAMLEEFRCKFFERFKPKSPKSRVFGLTTQLFPVSHADVEGS